jgi:hypothetical protein
MTTTNQKTALAKANIRTAYFVELQYPVGTQYYSSMNINMEWGGHVWVGLGAIAEVDGIEESANLDTQAVNFTLNIAQPAILAVAVGPVESYRGYPVKMHFCPLDENFRLIDTPELCWRGAMDTVAVGMEGESGKIVLKCESSANMLARRPALRANAAQQKLRFPNDTGFDYLTNIIANPQLWISKRFQAQMV